MKKLKVVSICGSRRKNGNTNLLLKGFEDEFKNFLPETRNKLFNIAEMDIRPCKSCLKCVKKEHCVIRDDFEKLANKMLESDLIILGSPVYFSDVSSPIKALIDRTFSLWHNKMLKGKNVILVAAAAESGTGHTIDTMRYWANDHEMNVICTVQARREETGTILQDEVTMKSIQDAAKDYSLKVS